MSYQDRAQSRAASSRRTSRETSPTEPSQSSTEAMSKQLVRRMSDSRKQIGRRPLRPAPAGQPPMFARTVTEPVTQKREVKKAMKEAPRLHLNLNLDVDIELKGKVQGDLTLALLEE